MQVTENLEPALRRLRGDYHWLWIDAICINQQDVEQRNQQVLRMKDIYSKAERVLVWTGPETEDSSRAIDLLDLLSSGSNPERDSAMKGSWVEKYRGPFKKEWRALYNFTRRPYWFRTWIIQELVVGEDVLILCGPRAISWERLNSALTLLDEACNFDMHNNMEGLMLLRAVNECHQVYRLGRTVRDQNMYRIMASLFNIMSSSYVADSTNPRDKIYALLGFTENGSTLVPHPDYSLKLEEIFILLTVAWLRKGWDAALITCRAVLWRDRSDLRSWTPDYLKAWTKASLTPKHLEIYFDHVTREQLFATPGTTPIISYSPINKTLTIRGRIIDTVDGLSATCNL
jgi:hypothetical protein